MIIKGCSNKPIPQAAYSQLISKLLPVAKSIMYGGMSQLEAIKLATINPAIQLKIDDRIGSVKIGKDADFVIWNGSPLSVYSKAEQTWIEGKKYFDHQEDKTNCEGSVHRHYWPDYPGQPDQENL